MSMEDVLGLMGAGNRRVSREDWKRAVLELLGSVPVAHAATDALEPWRELLGAVNDLDPNTVDSFVVVVRTKCETPDHEEHHDNCSKLTYGVGGNNFSLLALIQVLSLEGMLVMQSIEEDNNIQAVSVRTH